MAQSVVQLTCIQEVAGSNPGCKQNLFFLNINSYFANTFLEFNFDNTATSNSKDASKWDLGRVSNVKMQSQHFLVMTMYNC